MQNIRFELDGKNCCLLGDAGAAACVFCGMGDGDLEDLAKIAESVQTFCGGESFLLFAFVSEDWNRDFSPWLAPPVFGKETFAGEGEATLCWLKRSAISYLENENWICPDTKRYLAGYSLSGLFALWAFLESEKFDGAASCSGSLWFPGWLDYLHSRRRIPGGNVYLSLGSKEERAKNRVMATVGNCTRETYRVLKESSSISHTVLEWNKGGHFADSEQRLAKGIAKLITWNQADS